MGRPTTESDSLVCEREKQQAVSEYHWTRETRWEYGGPPSKPKYSLVTDSEEYCEGKVKKNPGRE